MFAKVVTMKKRKNNKNNTSTQNQQPKIEIDNTKKKMKFVDSVNNKKRRKLAESANNRTLILGFSKCCKTYPLNHILVQKQEPIFIITKSLNQYPNIKAQISDEIEPLENFENSTFVFDDLLLSKQESNIILLFTRGRHNNIDIYYRSQS